MLRRRALIAGAASALALPAYARDPFRERVTGQFKRRGMKPEPRYRVELDPNGRYSRGLQMLLLIDNPGQQADTLPVAWRDYANPGQSYVYNCASGSHFSVINSPFGGQALASLGANGAEDILLNNPLPSTATWTISSLVKFDGSTHNTQTGGLGIAGDQAFTHTPSVDQITGKWIDQNNTGAGFTGSIVSTWTTWTRVHLTEDGTTFSVYINGKLDGSNAQAMTFSEGILSFDWPWAQADMFYWNRTFSAADVAGHAADPYGTTMRSRFSPLGLKGNAGTVRPSLLPMTGVGP